MSCSCPDREEVDKLNTLSYSFHYRNIDSTEFYARKALAVSHRYKAGTAEAYNNLAFVSIAKMDYSLASRQLDSILTTTGNQIELLIADIQKMRLCQRQALNKEFYTYRMRALQRMRRINEEVSSLDSRQRLRLIYAESEFHFVESTYYYYVGLLRQSSESLSVAGSKEDLQRDTLQYLNYLYQLGSGDMVNSPDIHSVWDAEFKALLKCYQLSCESGNIYWEANSLQSISEHLINPDCREYLFSSHRIAMEYVNADNMPDSLVAGYLAQKSLEKFIAYGDKYQAAGAFRTLATCYWQVGDNASALSCLESAVSYPGIWQAPDLVASIREQMSIVYSAINDKASSDLNRNIYLDMQEKTRQDMELDARAAQLKDASSSLNIMITVIVILIVVILLLIMSLLKSSKNRQVNIEGIASSLSDCEEKSAKSEAELAESVEEKEEQLAVTLHDKERNKVRNVENRSKVFFLDSIIPLIDRMLNEVRKLVGRKESGSVRTDRLQYVSELASKIDEYNAVLSQWIELQKGEVKLNIESFSLNELFDTVRRSEANFGISGIQLHVENTSLTVKADKVLTLFMINTLADNARKFTPHGGNVYIYATDNGDSVEISVRDTGCGMSEEQQQKAFSHAIADGHGFGLSNCKGILEKYRKMSKLFDVCDITVQSKLGKGSTFSFSLPKGKPGASASIPFSIVILLFSLLSSIAVSANSKTVDGNLLKAEIYADSAYYSNINGGYSRTLEYADSVIKYINRHCQSVSHGERELMKSFSQSNRTAAEILWFHKGINTDYGIILDIRNESAVAALALHRWDLYEYNNTIYTHLFKEVSADKTLAEYCRVMEKSKTNKNVAIVVLAILLVILVVIGYTIYYRHALSVNTLKETISGIIATLDSDDSVAAKLERLRTISSTVVNPTLRQAVEKADTTLAALSASADSLHLHSAQLDEKIRKAQFERDRLYVSNNILENNLSTIKHETMYYPARISKYVAMLKSCGKSPESMEALSTVNDLTSYYRELYSILVGMAHRQLESVKYKCAELSLGEFIKTLPDCPEARILGDGDLLRLLLTLLRKTNSNEQPEYAYTPKDSLYAELTVRMHNVSFDSSSVMSIFVPKIENVNYLVCRQIIREFGAMTNRCDCGIRASASSNGSLELTITLPLSCRQADDVK